MFLTWKVEILFLKLKMGQKKSGYRKSSLSIWRVFWEEFFLVIRYEWSLMSFRIYYSSLLTYHSSKTPILTTAIFRMPSQRFKNGKKYNSSLDELYPDYRPNFKMRKSNLKQILTYVFFSLAYF